MEKTTKFVIETKNSIFFLILDPSSFFEKYKLQKIDIFQVIFFCASNSNYNKKKSIFIFFFHRVVIFEFSKKDCKK